MNQEVRMKRMLWGKEIRQLREKSQVLPDKQDLIAFYGSSSIRLWETIEEDLHPLNVINLGFGGSSYLWCNYFFEEVFEFVAPSKLVLYAGDNDLGNEVPEEEILESVNGLISKVDGKYGPIPIAIISVKPSPDRSYLKDKIESLNNRLQALIIRRPNGSFIDIYPAMLHSDGSLRPELYIEDELHINEKGYEIWKRVVGEGLVQRMSD
ncbi:MAG: GDSL-type esterase/lipase family protein [Bacteroidota bacterium]